MSVTERESRAEPNVGPTAVETPLAGCGSERFLAYSARHLEKIPQLAALANEDLFAMRVVARVLPFRTNRYVVEQLIDWSKAPDDPVFQLSFPQRGMLSPEHFDQMARLVTRGASKAESEVLANRIRHELNPHPAGQLELNVPRLDGEPLRGLQRKYRETVLFFPAGGQTCHAFCSFCFRWPQLVGGKLPRFASSSAAQLAQFLARNREITDVLVTGGDPMVMRTQLLRRYLQPLLAPTLDHVRTIRFGTKALSYWPQRFVSDPDADQLLRLLEQLVRAGKHVAIMAHVNHWQELESDVCRQAVQRLRSTGAVIRSQAPVLRHVNDSAQAWAETWRRQVALGIVPYYMFVARDTGARRYFEVPLHRSYAIYRGAIQQVSGLARTARGPSMSAAPGKVSVGGIAEVHGERVFVLHFIQARDPAWVQRPFFARYDESATWLDQLVPAFGRGRFFFEEARVDECTPVAHPGVVAAVSRRSSSLLRRTLRRDDHGRPSAASIAEERPEDSGTVAPHETRCEHDAAQ